MNQPEPENTLWVVDYIDVKGNPTETIISTANFALRYERAIKLSTIEVTMSLEGVVKQRLHGDIMFVMYLLNNKIDNIEAYYKIEAALGKLKACTLDKSILTNQKPKLLEKAALATV